MDVWWMMRGGGEGTQEQLSLSPLLGRPVGALISRCWRMDKFNHEQQEGERGPNPGLVVNPLRVGADGVRADAEPAGDHIDGEARQGKAGDLRLTA